VKIVRATIAVIAATVAATAIALAAMTLPAGTNFNAVMDNALNSSNAYVGQRFTMHVTAPYPSYSLQGAYLTGHVLSVQHASQGRKPELQLAIDRLVLRSGTAVNVSAQVTSMQQQKSESNLGHSALTAVGGMIAGNMVGKTLFHTALGGPVGLIGGALVGLNAKTNFTVPAGSHINVQLIHTVVVRTQSHG
jgi:F0F1-type ATP synthase assembly protein I